MCFDSQSTVCEQMRLMGECRGSIDAVKRAEEELTEGDVSGLGNPATVDPQGKGQTGAQTSPAPLVCAALIQPPPPQV